MSPALLLTLLVAGASPDVADAGVADVRVVADAGVVAGGIADAGVAAEARGVVGDGIVVVIDDQPSPLVFFRALGPRDAKKRAADARVALKNALELEPVDGATTEVAVHDGTATVRVKGRAVASFDVDDARAAGAGDLDAFADELETRLLHFVSEQQHRQSLQELAFRIFLSVFLCLLVVLTLRGLNRAFARADIFVDERDHKAFSVFDVPVLSGDAVRGVLASALLVGRAVAFVGVVVVGAAAVLAQFELTRPWLEQLAAAAFHPVLAGALGIVAALPGIVLALVLVLVVRGALRFVRVLLDGVAAGRVQSRFVAPPQAAVARPVVSVLVVVAAAPVIVAAAFGRFGTPVETLTLVVAGVVAAGTLPLLASAIVGAALLWRGAVRVGDWVSVDAGVGASNVVGEIAALGLTSLTLVPAEGGTVIVPMLALLWRPLRRLPTEPRRRESVRLRRSADVDTLTAAVVAVAVSIDNAAVVTLVAADHDTVEFAVEVALTAKQPLWPALVRAVDKGSFELAPR